MWHSFLLFLMDCFPTAVIPGMGRCIVLRPPAPAVRRSQLGAVRMSAAKAPSERKGCGLMFASHCLQMALPPHCFGCLSGSGSGSLSRAIPTLSPFGRDAAHFPPSPSSPPPWLRAAPVAPTGLCSQPSSFAVKKSHFNSSSTVCFLRLGLVTGALCSLV